MTETHRFNRQRLAWFFLFAGFFTCAFLSVATPLALNAYLQNADRPLNVMVQANQGTVGIDDISGQRRAVLAGEAGQPVAEDGRIRTDPTATALLLIQEADSVDPVARLQISSNSSVLVDQARAPRFGVSDHPNLLDLEVDSGRVRLDVPQPTDRPISLGVNTPQGRITIHDPGRYTLEVSNEVTQVTVHDMGQALVSGLGSTLRLVSGQRAEIQTNSSPIGPLDPARDLIQNGDFTDGLDNWSLFSWQVELEDQPEGVTEVRTDDGDPALRFSRQGTGHADVKISQSVNQDVSGLETLRVLSTLRILEQSLGVCGVQGSECPLFIVINYVDEAGVSRVWQHGFYAEGTVDDNLTPAACISCAVVQRAHERVPLNQFYLYEVDLRQELASQGFLPPRFIESIALVSSGHTFTADVTDISLIAEE